MIGTFPRVALATMLSSISDYCRQRKAELWVCQTYPVSDSYIVADVGHSSCSPHIGAALYRIRPSGEISATPALRLAEASDAVVAGLARGIGGGR